MAPDGSYLIFASSRPLPGSDHTPDGFWEGMKRPGKGGNLWRVDRTSSGWGTPVRLPDMVNRSANVFSPAVAANGNLYFMEAYGPHADFRLFSAHFNGRTYDAPQPLSFSTGQWTDEDPAVAPDESFIIFSSTRPPAAASQADLFIAFRRGGGWSTPRHLPEDVNRLSPIIEARLGPDRRTLYFTSNYVVPPAYPTNAAGVRRQLRDMQDWNDGLGNIWKVDISDLLP